MFCVYVLENKQGKHYIGSTWDLENRIKRHNQNSVRSTKHKGPYQLIYKEEFHTKTEARRRELQLKSFKDPQRIKRTIRINDPIV